MVYHKKAQEPKAKKITTTKIEAALSTMANMVAIHRGVSLQAYLDGILRPIVEKDYRTMGEQITRNR